MRRGEKECLTGVALKLDKPSIAWPVGCSNLFAAVSLPRRDARHPSADIPPVLLIAVPEALLQPWLLPIDHNQMENQEHCRGQPKTEGRTLSRRNGD